MNTTIKLFPRVQRIGNPWSRRGFSCQCNAKDYWYSPMEASFIIGGLTASLILSTIREVQRQQNGKLRDIEGLQRKVLAELKKLQPE